MSFLGRRRAWTWYDRPEAAAAQPPAAVEIDLPALAERVYDLLRREVRIERERFGR